jgi:hypothetical protein
MLFKEGYVYDPLALFTHLPGYRLSPVSGLQKTTGAASDLFDAFLPQWNYTYTWIREGTFPLWRFNKGLGVAQYEQSYHPENLIPFIVEPSEALTIRVLLKLFLSMIGMYFLLRSLKIKELACMIGGIGYALSGFIIGWLHGPQSTVAWHIPFLFLFLIQYLKSRQTKFLFYFALWSSLTIYSGFLPVAGYSLYGVGLFLAAFYVFDRRRLFSKIRELLKISLYWILGIFTVAFSFVLFYYLAFISKSFDIGYRHVGRVVHLSPKYFKNIVFPFYDGWRITPEIRPYVSSILILFFISGFIAFILRFVKLKKRFLEKAKYYLAFFVVLIPFMMAMFGLFPFYQIACQLPVLKSSPLLRLQSMTSFLLVVLGVMGLEWIVRSYMRIREVSQKRKYVFWTVTGILFLCSIMVAAMSSSSDGETGFHTAYPVFCFVALVILAFLVSILLKKNPAFFLIILLPLVSVETVIQNRRYVPVNRKIHFITELKVPLVDFLKKHLRRHEGVLVFDSNYNINGTLGNYGIREIIVHEFHRWEYKALIVDTFSQRSFASPTAPALVSAHTEFSSSFIQLMGVKHLIFRSDFRGESLPAYYKPVYKNLDGQVFENTLYRKNRGIFLCKPKYFTPENKTKILKDIKDMDYQSHVYLAEDEKLGLDYEDNMSCSLRVVSYTPNKVVYSYRTNSDGILTFPEAFDKGWSVAVNGEKKDVLRTNLIFRGVAVKRGKGNIVFTYHISKPFVILVSIGLAAFILLVVLYILSEKFRRKGQRDEVQPWADFRGYKEVNRE